MERRLECPNKLHGILVDGDVIETKCNSKFCGHRPGIVVLHRWSIATGDLLETRKFTSTPSRKEEPQDGSPSQHLAVRSA